VARGTVTHSTGAYKDSQLFVSVRHVAVESRQGNPSKLLLAKLRTDTQLLINLSAPTDAQFCLLHDADKSVNQIRERG